MGHHARQPRSLGDEPPVRLALDLDPQSPSGHVASSKTRLSLYLGQSPRTTDVHHTYRPAAARSWFSRNSRRRISSSSIPSGQP